MTYFTSNDVNVQVSVADMVFDIDSYYCYVEITSLARIPIGAKVLMHTSDTVELVCIASQYKAEMYQSTLISMKQRELLSTVTEPISGTYSVRQLLSKLGVAHAIQYDSGVSNWCLPSLNFKSLIDALSKYTPGIASRFYTDLLGNVRYVDIGAAFNSKELEPMKGYVVEDGCDIDWMLRIPVNLIAYTYTTEGVKVERIENNRNYTYAKAYFNDTTGLAASMGIQAFKNEFNLSNYKSRHIIIEQVMTLNHYLGQPVLINDNQKGVITYLRLPIILNTESRFISATISCPAS